MTLGMSKMDFSLNDNIKKIKSKRDPQDLKINK